MRTREVRVPSHKLFVEKPSELNVPLRFLLKDSIRVLRISFRKGYLAQKVGHVRVDLERMNTLNGLRKVNAALFMKLVRRNRI